jgi:single-strand DNA-binding protein
LGIAVNRRWTAQDGQQKEEVTFADCTAYGKQAETLSKYMKKGRPIFIEGRLKLDQWEAQDGTKRSKIRIVVEGFQFLGGPDSRSSESAAEDAPPRYQPRSAPQNARPAAPRADDEPPPVSDDDIPF